MKKVSRRTVLKTVGLLPAAVAAGVAFENKVMPEIGQNQTVTFLEFMARHAPHDRHPTIAVAGLCGSGMSSVTLMLAGLYGTSCVILDTLGEEFPPSLNSIVVSCDVEEPYDDTIHVRGLRLMREVQRFRRVLQGKRGCPILFQVACTSSIFAPDGVKIASIPSSVLQEADVTLRCAALREKKHIEFWVSVETNRHGPKGVAFNITDQRQLRKCGFV